MTRLAVVSAFGATQFFPIVASNPDARPGTGTEVWPRESGNGSNAFPAAFESGLKNEHDALPGVVC